MEDMNLTNSNVNSENSVEMAPVTPAAPVVGFQAVDAEGNVVGFISKADLVNEAKQALYADLAFMEQNRPMTLPANTEQLAATAAAATDVYEDQLAIKSDAPFIRGLDAAGNPIRISKADLATVVGGLIQKTYIFFESGSVTIPSYNDTTALDNIIASGIYIVRVTNESWGTLFVFSSFSGAGGVIQLLCNGLGDGTYKMRTKLSNDENLWSSWKNL